MYWVLASRYNKQPKLEGVGDLFVTLSAPKNFPKPKFPIPIKSKLVNFLPGPVIQYEPLVSKFYVMFSWNKENRENAKSCSNISDSPF